MKGEDLFSMVAVLAALLSTIAVHAGAGCGEIPAGEWVFIGEEGLDLSAAGVEAGSVLAYYGPGGSTSGVPSARVTVADPSSFYVSPATFSGKTGPWFLLPDNRLVFYVAEPTLEVRVVDATSGFVVGKDASWVPKGDAVGFRIDTNLWVFSRRPGCRGVPLTLEVSGPGGLSLSSLGGLSLKDVVVDSPTFETGPVWQTGSPEYPVGEYRVTVRCEANGMHENYPSTGKTESGTVSFLLQRVNPLIATPTTTATAGASPPVTVQVPPATVPGTPLPPGTTPPATGEAVPVAPAAMVQPQGSPTPTRAQGLLPATAVLALGAVLAFRAARRQG
ncbi:MAG: DUF3821 domain-containing protein [Methanolinea sp.]|nr:DUF3821 domain-containing protein [Methanolinea sp.]